jgi:hypothetical protein
MEIIAKARHVEHGIILSALAYVPKAGSQFFPDGFPEEVFERLKVFRLDLHGFSPCSLGSTR